MNGPKNYKEWIECLEKIENGVNDTSILSYMNCGSLELEASVGVRFSRHLGETIHLRIEKGIKRFEKSNKRHNGNVNQLTRSILQLRKEFNYLVQLSRLDILPKEQSDILVDYIIDTADSIQKSLEKSSLKNDRSGMVHSVLKNNRINNLII